MARNVSPEARKALDMLKVEVARELGLHNYDNMDKGSLTARQHGQVGGNMVKRMIEMAKNNIK